MLIEDCIFCKIIRGEIPSTKVYEDEKTLVIMDINPASKGHMLVLPKYHAPLLEDLPLEYALAVITTAKKVVSALSKSDLAPTASNLWVNNGADAGQEIDHFHLHIVPRYPNDGIRIHVPNRPPKGIDFATAATSVNSQITD